MTHTHCIIVHQQGDNPCHECDRNACVRFRDNDELLLPILQACAQHTRSLLELLDICSLLVVANCFSLLPTPVPSTANNTPHRNRNAPSGGYHLLVCHLYALKMIKAYVTKARVFLGYVRQLSVSSENIHH